MSKDKEQIAVCKPALATILRDVEITLHRMYGANQAKVQMVSNGEYVISAVCVDRWTGDLEVMRQDLLKILASGEVLVDVSSATEDHV